MRRGFHRPMRSHLAAIGSTPKASSPPPPNTTSRGVDPEHAVRPPAAQAEPGVQRQRTASDAAEERQQLQRAAQRQYRGVPGRPRPAPPQAAPGPVPAPARRRPGPPVRERGGQAAHRRVQVDVLHRHRRQAAALADRGVEPGHQQRAGAEVVEEMAVDRDPLDVQDARPAARPARVRCRSPGRRGRRRRPAARAARRGQAACGRPCRWASPGSPAAAPGRPGPCTRAAARAGCA